MCGSKFYERLTCDNALFAQTTVIITLQESQLESNVITTARVEKANHNSFTEWQNTEICPKLCMRVTADRIFLWNRIFFGHQSHRKENCDDVYAGAGLSFAVCQHMLIDLEHLFRACSPACSTAALSLKHAADMTKVLCTNRFENDHLADHVTRR